MKKPFLFLQNINSLKKLKKYIPYIFIIFGAIIAFFSAIFASGFWFYLLSMLGLLVSVLGQFISTWIEKNILKLDNEFSLQRKLTPPNIVNIDLKYENIKTYKIIFEIDNLIPIKFKFAILNEQNEYLSGIFLDWHEVYPTTEQKIFNVDCRINKTPINSLKLKFDYQSLWCQEMNKKGLAGTITKIYKINRGDIEFAEEQRQ